MLTKHSVREKERERGGANEKIQSAHSDRRFKCCPNEKNTHKSLTHLLVWFVQPGISGFWYSLDKQIIYRVEMEGKRVKRFTLSQSVLKSVGVRSKSTYIHSIHSHSHTLTLRTYLSFKSKFVYILFSIKLQQVIKCEPTISQTEIRIIHTTFKPSFSRRKERQRQRARQWQQ